MEDVKRETVKVKRPKSDHVKSAVQIYLQKRNYGSKNFLANSQIDQQIIYSTIESAISQTNSIFYSSHTNDPSAIDQNFKKFLTWLSDLIKTKNSFEDIEELVPPLFCHLYLNILKSANPEKAASFLKSHQSSIDTTNCDFFMKKLISNLDSTNPADLKNQQDFREHKYYLELSSESIKQLKAFVLEHCQVFLQILNTWFDLDEKEMTDAHEPEPAAVNGAKSGGKLENLAEAIKALDLEPKQIYSIRLTFAKEVVNCGLLNRKAGILAYNQANTVHIRPINAYDNVFGSNCREIQLIDHSRQVTCFAVSPDHATFVTGSLDSFLCIYCLRSNALLKKCSGHLGPVNCVAVSRNAQYVASGSHDATARLWSLENGHNLRIFVGHTKAVTCAHFHPNCLYLATGSVDGSVRMWSIDNGNALRLLLGAKGVIYSCAFSPLGNCLAGAGDDAKIRIWDLLTTKVSDELKFKGEPITKLVWSDDGSELASGGCDGEIRIWDLSKKDEKNCESTAKNAEPITSFSINGKLLSLDYCFDMFDCISA